MHNTLLIAQREYLERIRAKSFIVMTILIPLLMGGLVFGSAMLSGHRSGTTQIAVVTQDLQFGLDLKAELARGDDNKIETEIISPPAADTRTVLTNQVKDGDLDGYLWVTPAGSGQVRASFQWVPKAKSDIITKETVGSAVRTVLTRERLTHSGMGATDVDALLQPIDLDTANGAKHSTENGAVTAIGTAYGLFFLMYFVIVTYCMNIGRSIIDDKTSRIFEVLLATVRPAELMAGKLIGIGGVGLTQVGIWITAGIALAAYGLRGRDFSVPLNFVQVLYFIVFFLLGYLLYSSVASALGAMVSSQQELQQMNIFLMLPLFVCNAVIFQVVTNPEGTLARVFSFIPFCTPLIMYVRIAVHQPPFWQIALSIVEMILTIYAIVWLAARIYRVGILMYGKRPNLPEILRWLRYS